MQWGLTSTVSGGNSNVAVNLFLPYENKYTVLFNSNNASGYVANILTNKTSLKYFEIDPRYGYSGTNPSVYWFTIGF